MVSKKLDFLNVLEIIREEVGTIGWVLKVILGVWICVDSESGSSRMMGSWWVGTELGFWRLVVDYWHVNKEYGYWFFWKLRIE